MYPPKEVENSFPKYYLWMIVNILVGVILGWVVERVAQAIQSAFRYPAAVAILVQLSLSILVLYVLVRLSKRYFPRWHDSRPGFVWVFFIVQYSFFINLFLVGTSLGIVSGQRITIDVTKAT